MSDLFNIEYLKNNVEIIPLSTAAVALFGLLITTVVKVLLELVVNKMKIKADVISKSRVDWIQDVRALTGEYINDAQYFTNYIFSYPYYIQTKDKEVVIDELNIRHNKLLSTKNKLTMYFPEYNDLKDIENEKINKNNQVINNIIQNMYGDLKKYSDYVVNNNKVEGFTADIGKDGNSFIEEHYKLLNLNMSTYLKKEWIRAKKNK